MDAEQTEDITALAQKTTKYSYKSRCHSESKGMTAGMRDAQGGNKKRKESHKEQLSTIRSLCCKGD